MKINKLIINITFLILATNLTAQEENFISLYVYNFIKYFEWPEERRSGDFVIEVLGHKSVYDKLVEVTANKRAGTQNIILRHYMNVDEMGSPHIMFIGHWHFRETEEVISKIRNTPTLIIAEREGMLEKGAAINFVIREGRMKFEISKSNAQKYGLQVDMQLEGLAYKSY